MLFAIKLVLEYEMQKARITEQQKSDFLSVLFVLFLFHLFCLNETTNLEAFRFINHYGQVFPAGVQAFISELGNGLFLGTLALGIMVKQPKWSVRILLAVVICTISVHLAKNYFDTPRPAAVLKMLNIIGDPRYSESFPSAHTTSVFLAAGLLWHSELSVKFKMLGLGIATGTALARVSVGAHWPEDVVIGAMLGWLCAHLACKYAALVPLSHKVRFGLYLFLFVVLISSEFSSSDHFADYPVIKLVRLGLLGYVAYLIYRAWGEAPKRVVLPS